MTTEDQLASVRYIVDDVEGAVDFYTTHLGFTLRFSAGAAFADVVRGPLRLLISGPTSSGARSTPAENAAAGRNRIHLVLDDFDSEVADLRAAGAVLRQRRRVRPGWTPDPPRRPRGKSRGALRAGPGALTARASFAPGNRSLTAQQYAPRGRSSMSSGSFSGRRFGGNFHSGQPRAS